MYIYVYKYISTYVHKYLYICIHTRMYIYAYTYLCIYIHLRSEAARYEMFSLCRSLYGDLEKRNLQKRPTQRRTKYPS